MKTDPDGRFFFLAAGIGAAFGLFDGLSRGKKGMDLFGSVFSGAVIGGLSAGFGTAVGGATKGLGTVLSGALSGATAGGISGGFTSAMNGGSFGKGFLDGALWGGIGGGISGAIFKGKIHEEVSTGSDIKDLTGWDIDASTKSANSFSDNYFPGVKEEVGTSFRVPTATDLPSGYTLDSQTQLLVNKKGEFINGLQSPKLFGKSQIWLSPSRFTNDRLLFRTMGHELIHAWHGSITPYYKQLGDAYTNLTESVAHNWSLAMGVKMGFDDFKSSYTMFGNHFSQLSRESVSQYYNQYHWSHHSVFSRYLFSKY
jgi:hypothetical protein